MVTQLPHIDLAIMQTFGSRKKYNAVSLSVCGPQTEYEDSPKMQAIQKVINLWSIDTSQQHSSQQNFSLETLGQENR